MTSWPIGLSTGCFYHRSILDCLPLIRESGFSMIEVCSTPEHLNFHDLKLVDRAAERIRDLGMEAYSFHAPFAPHIDIASSDDGQRSASSGRNFQGGSSSRAFAGPLFRASSRAGKSGDHRSFGTTAAHAACSRVIEPGRPTLPGARHYLRPGKQTAASAFREHE